MTNTALNPQHLFIVASAILSVSQVAAVAQVGAPIIDTSNNPLELAPSHFTLSVANIDKESAWYHEVLGFQEYERVPHGSDFVHCSLRIPGVYRVDLNWQKGSVRRSTPGFLQSGGATGKGVGNMEQGYTHIVFKTALSLDTVNQQLIAKKANVVAAKEKSGSVSNILVYDPEGNEIEIQH